MAGFDLIFSVMPLEHIPDFEAAFAGMAAVLAPQGRMIHLCPNYMVPYEPHFGLPLVPLAPRATALLLPSLKASGLWRSLNFVTYRRVRRCAAAAGLTVEFAPRMMLRAFERLDRDPIYRGAPARPRHDGLRSVARARPAAPHWRAALSAFRRRCCSSSRAGELQPVLFAERL